MDTNNITTRSRGLERFTGSYLVEFGGSNDYGVYSSHQLNRYGPFDTPMLFRGTFAECIAWRKHDDYREINPSTWGDSKQWPV